MKLTDTQLVLLSAAAQRQDGAVELGSKLKGASQKVIGKLLSEHMIEEIPAGAPCRFGGAMMNKERSPCASPTTALPRSARWTAPTRTPVSPGRPKQPSAHPAVLRAEPQHAASRPTRLGTSSPKPVAQSRSRRW